jgi:methylated-DNA-protein-cysteine methyltransferase-like protein
MEKLSEFSAKVIGYIKKIPQGKVATYGQIAKLSGKPQGSRGVAWILNSCSKAYDLPWHRVLNSKGQISFPSATTSYRKQKSLLVKEGVEFNNKGQIDMAKFQWKKEPTKKKASGKSPRMFT